MNWKIFGTEIHFDVQAAAKGDTWIGIGFSQGPAGQMIGTDAVVAGDFGETDLISSRKIIAKSSLGVQLGGAMNITSTDFWRSARSPGMHFARQLHTGTLGDGQHVYMVAVASSEPYPVRHTLYSKGAVQINLETGVVDPPSFVWSTAATHGLLMYISFGILFPFGYVWARYAKGFPNALWFEGHRAAMTGAFLITLVAAAFAFGMVSDDHFKTVWHSQVGMVALTGVLFQICSGILRPHLDPQKKSYVRFSFEWAHHIMGRVAILAGWTAIFGGLMILPNVPILFVYIHGGVVFVWLVVNIGLEIYSRRNKRRENYESVSNGFHKK